MFAPDGTSRVAVEPPLVPPTLHVRLVEVTSVTGLLFCGDDKSDDPPLVVSAWMYRLLIEAVERREEVSDTVNLAFEDTRTVSTRRSANRV